MPSLSRRSKQPSSTKRLPFTSSPVGRLFQTPEPFQISLPNRNRLSASDFTTAMTNNSGGTVNGNAAINEAVCKASSPPAYSSTPAIAP